VSEPTPSAPDHGGGRDANEEPSTSSAWRLPVFLRPFESLAFREYRLLWLSQVGVASALWTEQVASNWLTYQMTGSALQLGLVNLMRGIPVMAFGLFGGVLADRIDRRKLLLIIQVWSMVVYLAMGWIILSGNLALWHLYASSFALSLGGAMDGPLRTSTIPSLVPADRLINALSLNGIAINGTRLLLPAGVGVMLGVASPGWAYILLAAVYVLVQITTAQLRLPAAPERERPRSMLGDMRDGVGFVRSNRTVLALLISAVGLQGIGFSHRALMPVFAVDNLGMGSGTYGALLSADGLGAVAGGLIIASVGFSRRKGLLMLAFAAVNAGAILLLGWVPWLVLAAMTVMIIGGTSTGFRSSNNSLLLGHTPIELRGRVMGINGLNQGIAPIMMVVVGAIADATNVTVALSVIGAAGLLISAGVTLKQRALLRE
jgi:MFS family permease